MTGRNSIMVFKLPYVVPGLNGSDGLIREHWTKATKRKNKIKFDLKVQKKSGQSVPLSECFIIFVTHRVCLMDWDNCVASFKYIGDGLREVGVIKDDKPAVIKYIFPIQQKVKTRSDERTEIHILAPDTTFRMIRYVLKLINA